MWCVFTKKSLSLATAFLLTASMIIYGAANASKPSGGNTNQNLDLAQKVGNKQGAEKPTKTPAPQRRRKQVPENTEKPTTTQKQQYTPEQMRRILRGLGYKIEVSKEPLTDEESKKAITEFQQGYKLGVDGLLGDQTQDYAFGIIKILQSNLNLVLELNPPLRSNGVYGPRTEAAVKEFQKKFQITETGIADLPTRQKLDEEARKLLKKPADTVAPPKKPTTKPTPSKKPRPTTSPSPEATPTTSPSPEATPTTSPSPEATPTTSPSPEATPTTSPSPEATPTTSPSPEATPTTSPSPKLKK